MKKILAIGFNPAYQRTEVFDAVTLGAVNRAALEVVSAGGKALHFAKAAHALLPASASPAYFIGGHPGQYIREELDTLGIESLTVELPGDTRTCTTVIDSRSGQSTELISPSLPIPESAARQMRALLLGRIADFDALAFCGTYPPGISEQFLLELAQKNSPQPLLIDAYTGIDAILEHADITILKINMDEACTLTGAASPTAIAEACFSKYSIVYLMLTDGPNQAHLFTGASHYTYELPKVTCRNPIGAGDTCAAITFVSFVSGVLPKEAFARGLAAASASCRHYEGAVFNHEDVRLIRDAIRITTR